MAFPNHMRPIEATIVGNLIKKALGLGWTVSVYDGEEWALQQSSDYEAITTEIAATDETQIIFRGGIGQRIGWLQLIHGNDEDVISDHTDNIAMGLLVQGLAA
ncbi:MULTISPECIES: hypothetical protein [unclassified Mesorhizobium]|uniref:hypothetical protein n=1 Tax=unclassified Mesorhizobium TaxID=325217 RepID=UPI00112A8298|nr:MULTISPECIES: hypothetical protein [unclassified Mesorhizobium]TPJ51767.1 hypothetical protein FJ426_18860 [Mesorhizobium sp. B2-6-4]TPN42389.1 hypothetical protein FJ979_02275 [Mesorhizobium sp. B1-1-6]